MPLSLLCAVLWIVPADLHGPPVDEPASPPSAEVAPLGIEDAAHLLGRLGLGGSVEELREYANLSRTAAVERLLAGSTTPVTVLPEWATTSPASDFAGSELSRDEMRKKRQELQRTRGRELKAWWFDELVATRSPAVERMTLFWHNHFTSSLRKVKSPRLMLQQNQLLRQHALGNFRTLLTEVSRDPAMLQYLDGQRSRKGKPNENFARELLELFTLGEGHYSETDIREAARAFTGWRIQRATGKARQIPRQRDRGTKVFMGQEGDFDGDDILGIVLAQPRCAEFLVEKLWTTFVSPNPDAQEVRRLAGVLRESQFEMRPVLRALLLSDAFWASEHRGSLIKSPVDLIVGTVRIFAIPVSRTNTLVQLSRRLGQDLLDPPNVKGWPGGDEWITSDTLLTRQAFLRSLGSAEAGGGERRMRDRPRNERQKRNVERRRARTEQQQRQRIREWLSQLSEERKGRRAQVRSLLLRTPPVDPNAANSETDVAHLRALLIDPAYQVK